MKITVGNCQLIKLPVFVDNAGNVSTIHGNENIPFQIKRLFYLYDIPGGKDRGAHAHIQCHQFLIAGSGAFEIVVDDGINKKLFLMNRTNYGLHIPPGIWASEKNFSNGSICLVLCSHGYVEKDYIRDYREFLNFRKEIVYNETNKLS